MRTPNPKRVASMYLEKEAGLFDFWETYVTRPIDSLIKRAPQLKNGPIGDVVDDVFRDIAPIVSKEIQKQMVQIRLEEFESGAFSGAKDHIDGRKPAMKGKSFYPKYNCPRECDWVLQGYLVGYEKPSAVSKKGLADKKLKDAVLKAIVKQEEKDLSENVIFSKLYGIWSAINPVNLVKMTIEMVKKHGWKIGVGIALVQAVETFVIPAVATGLGAPPPVAAALSQLPITEIVLPIAASKLGIEIGDPPVITDDVDEFLEQNPGIRLGANMNLSAKDLLREVRSILASELEAEKDEARAEADQQKAEAEEAEANAERMASSICFSNSSPFGNVKRRRKMAIDRSTIYEIDNIMGFIWSKWLKGDDKKLFKKSAKEVARILIEERGMTDEEAIEYVQKVASWTERMEDWATD